MDALKPKSLLAASEAATSEDSSPGPSSADQHIAWFRQASPYIYAHSGKTFVLCFSGSALASTHFPTLIHDITLLKNLGVRLVLVYGLRPQIDQQLRAQGYSSGFNAGLRITTEAQMATVIAEVGRARIQIESRLSMGMPNSPMSGTHASVASGNFVTAQPYGVLAGVDHCHTGMVRQIHANAIRRQIDNDQLVLLSPIGYSRTGEIFNLEATDVAMHAAIAIKAEKLIYISRHQLEDANGQSVTETRPTALEKMLPSQAMDSPAQRLATKAIQACKSGVKRVHVLNENDTNSLLKELYTRDGSGNMVNADNYETLRSATIADVGGIIELIKPLEQDGTLVKRSREQLELDIERFCVIERDGLVITCAALLPLEPERHESERQHPRCGEIACLATHPDYRNGGRAEALLAHLEDLALERGLDSLFVLTTRSDHWFIEHGFIAAGAEQLPAGRRNALHNGRNSKILCKATRFQS